jgi:hypothetical protein
MMARRMQVLHKLYVTGVFFFALAYVGRDLLPIAALLQATHNEQHFQGVQDPALQASLPVGERSILGNLLPESLLYQLEAYGARAFAEQMTRCAHARGRSGRPVATSAPVATPVHAAGTWTTRRCSGARQCGKRSCCRRCMRTWARSRCACATTCSRATTSHRCRR